MTYEKQCVLHPDSRVYGGSGYRSFVVVSILIPACSDSPYGVQPLRLRLCEQDCVRLFRELIEKTYGVRFVDYKKWTEWSLVKA